MNTCLPIGHKRRTFWAFKHPLLASSNLVVCAVHPAVTFAQLNIILNIMLFRILMPWRRLFCHDKFCSHVLPNTCLGKTESDAIYSHGFSLCVCTRICICIDIRTVYTKKSNKQKSCKTKHCCNEGAVCAFSINHERKDTLGWNNITIVLTKY